MTSVVEFESAANYYKRSGRGFSYTTKVKLYGLFKQATKGDADAEDKEKLERGLFASSWKGDRFNSWLGYRGMLPGEARSQYVSLVVESDSNYATAEVASATAAALATAATERPPPPFRVDEEVFAAAVETVSDIKSELPAGDKLGFYGLFKQARFGDNDTARPGMLDPVGGAKWDAWWSRRSLPEQSAKEAYVAYLLALHPGWDPESYEDEKQRQSAAQALNQEDGYGSGGYGSDYESERVIGPPASSFVARRTVRYSGGGGDGGEEGAESDTSLPPPPPTAAATRAISSPAATRPVAGSNDDNDGDGDGDATGSLGRSAARVFRNLSAAATTTATTTILSPASSMAAAGGGVGPHHPLQTRRCGWLNKMQEREQNVLLWSGSGGKWAKRFFVLDGGSLNYFRNQGDTAPRGSFALHRCTVRREGPKDLKRGNNPTFHVLALYLIGTEGTYRGPSAGALLRVSSESEAEIEDWFTALAQRCQNQFAATAASSSSAPFSPTNQQQQQQQQQQQRLLRVSTYSPHHASQSSSALSALTALSLGGGSTSPSSVPPASPCATPSGGVEGTARLSPSISAPLLESSASASGGGGGGDDCASGGGGGAAKVTAGGSDGGKRLLEPTGNNSNEGGGGAEEEAAAEPTEAEAAAEEKRRRSQKGGFPASKPMHRCSQASYLSSEESAKQNYRGLFNLAALILVVSNLRMFLKSLLTYGLLLKPLEIPRFLRSLASLLTGAAQESGGGDDDKWALDPRDYPHASSFALHHFCLVGCFLIERYATKHPTTTPEALVRLAHTVNISLSVALPTWLVWQAGGQERAHEHDPLVGLAVMFSTVIVAMKLISYAHVNADYRLAAREAASVPMDQVEEVMAKYTNTVLDTDPTGLLRYPYNVTLGNVYYFWASPTLTYQLNFPVSPHKVRKWMVVSLVLRMGAVVSLMVFLLQQHVVPSVQEATQSIDRLEPWHIVERLLYVAMPVTYLWLLMFYLVFHLLLNLLAECLRFGDRVFYKDWWNATTFEDYWRLWNLPVHYWMVRHLYFPCVRAGFNRNQCVFFCFFFSAAFHELLVSVPFHMPRLYTFGAMLAQIPLVAITQKLEKSAFWREVSGGNYLFWALFCIVGQPMAVLLYYYDSQVVAAQLMTANTNLGAAHASVAAVEGAGGGGVNGLGRGLLHLFGGLVVPAGRLGSDTAHGALLNEEGGMAQEYTSVAGAAAGRFFGVVQAMFQSATDSFTDSVSSEL